MANSAKSTPVTLSGHTRPITDINFNESYLITAAKDGKPIVRATNGVMKTCLEGHKGAVLGVAIQSCSNLVSTGSADFSARLWSLKEGRNIQTFSHEHVVKSVAFSRDQKMLLTGSKEHFLKIFDLNKPVDDFMERYSVKGSVERAFFIRDDKCVISCVDRDKSLRIWDRNSGQEVQNISEFDEGMAPENMELSRDGKTLTVIHGSSVSFYDLEAMVKLKKFSMPCKLEAASLHPDKTCFVCGGADFKVYKFDYTTGTEIESYKGHFGPIHCIKFSWEGDVYASGSEDGTVRMWQTTQTTV